MEEFLENPETLLERTVRHKIRESDEKYFKE